jgi:hypothetical protein
VPRRTHVQLTAGLFLVAHWVQGCVGGECRDGEKSCDGATVLACSGGSSHEPGGSYLFWQRSDCSDGKICVSKSAKSAICALSAQPEPRCAGAIAFCDGQDIVECEDGLALDRGSCGPDMVCVAGGEKGPFCALGPDARCADIGADALASYCDGASLVECHGVSATRVQTCPTGCVQAAPHDAVCVLSTTPDPRCDPPSTPSGYCDGTVVVVCVSGYQTSQGDCSTYSAHSTCEEVNGIGICK